MDEGEDGTDRPPRDAAPADPARTDVDPADGAPAEGAAGPGRDPVLEDRRVVGCVLRRGVEVLLCRRSDAVGTDRGRWALVTGCAGGDPEAAARREVSAAVEFPGDCELVRRADPLTVPDADLEVRWHVHPFLFECTSTDAEPNEEVAAHEWVQPPAILERETVPGLWATYRAVAPTVETVREDARHGSAYLSLRALEVLRDAAAAAAHGVDGGPAGADDLAALARRLRMARPGMGVVRTRIDRAMATADRSPASVLERAREACSRAVDADRRAAAAAADRVGSSVLTLSRSGTVLAALRRADPEAVVVAESRPAREGVGVAEELADAFGTDGPEVALCVDAAMAHVVDGEAVDTVLFGADTVLADGTVVNKTGSRLAALAAAGAADDGGADCLVVCAADKIVPDVEPTIETGPPDAVYDGDATVDVFNPTLEAVPPGLVDAVVTEDGALSTADVRAVADEHRDLARWDE